MNPRAGARIYHIHITEKSPSILAPKAMGQDRNGDLITHHPAKTRRLTMSNHDFESLTGFIGSLLKITVPLADDEIELEKADVKEFLSWLCDHFNAVQKGITEERVRGYEIMVEQFQKAKAEKVHP